MDNIPINIYVGRTYFVKICMGWVLLATTHMCNSLYTEYQPLSLLCVVR